MSTSRCSSRVIPVLCLGIVEAQSNSILLTSRRQFLQRVALEWRRVINIPVGDHRVEHRKSVVVLRRDHDVFHPRVLGNLHPFFGIVINRVELLGVCLILVHRNLARVHDPLADSANSLAVVSPGRNRIHAPVNEHSKACLTEPLHSRITLFFGFVGVRIGAGRL